MNFYKEAATMLDSIESKKTSIKGCLSRAAEKDRKRFGALVIDTLRFKRTILSVIEATPIMRDERRHLHSQNFAMVLIHDLLFTPGGIQAADGPIKQAISRHKTRLQAELVKLKIRRGVRSNDELAQPNDPRAATIPRYLRVNRNLWSIKDATQHYSSKNYLFNESLGLPLQNQFYHDKHVPDLLVFNAEYSLHSDDAYKSGKIIAQDKASCFSAFVLDPPALDDAYIIDATAAPGNKTSHLSALMNNKGKIFAFERDKRRFKTLEQMLHKASCENVEPVLDDFLRQDPNDARFRKVTHILLDPSCSGSGIVNRLDYLTAEDGVEDSSNSRLDTLSAFQKKMILHAVKFPEVVRIVYSTCSIHTEENEAVVQAVLNEQAMLDSGFRLAPRSQVMPSWHRRGIPYTGLNQEEVDSLVRCSPGDDIPGTNGFFVACFVRDNSAVQAPPRRKPKRKRSSTSLAALPKPRKRQGD